VIEAREREFHLLTGKEVIELDLPLCKVDAISYTISQLVSKDILESTAWMLLALRGSLPCNTAHSI